MRTLKTVVVIGGGITGLSTMHYLQKLKKENDLDLELILIEQNEHLGGKIHSVKKDEFIMETGADSIVARHESVMPFLSDLGLEDEVVYNSTGLSYIYTNNELHQIPVDTVFGIPTSVESLFKSTLVSEEGKQTALLDLETTNDQFTKDSSIGSFLEYFLGKELVEKQIAPVLSGVYSGDLNKLSIASTLPYLLEYKNTYGSIIKGLAENKEQFSKSNKKFISFKNGMSTLIDAVEEQLDECVILRGVLTTNIRKVNERYEISCSNDNKMIADYVVVTTPDHVAKSLFKNKDLDDDFSKLTTSSLKSVYLGFNLSDDHLPADGTGFIVSENSDVHCDACTWTSRKWTHTSPEHNLLVRLFYKSSNEIYSSLVKMNEDEMIEFALTDVKNSLGITQKPIVVEVTNWDKLMPNYLLHHNQAVTSLTEKLSTLFPNVLLAGCSYYGVGIGPCIKNGKETAEKIVANL